MNYVAFDEFAEMLERNCISLWRTVVGRDDDDVILQVNSILFTKKISDDGMWVFGFALRRISRWYQHQSEIEPIEYDPIDPPREFDPNKSVSPQNRASTLAVDMVQSVVDSMRGAL